MEYRTTVEIDKNLNDKIRKYTTEQPTCEEECTGENMTISVTAIFPNGYQMDIKCCGVDYDEESSDNTAWTEAVLFNEKGCQLNYTEPSFADDFIGKWTIEYNNDIYTANIVLKENAA